MPSRPIDGLDIAPLRSSPVEHLALGRPVRLDREPSPRYPGGGGESLVDGILGSEDVLDGTWLGCQDVDVEVTLALEQLTTVRRVGCSFLQTKASWIFLPRTVELAVSTDGVAYTVVERFEQDARPDPAQVTKDDAARFEPREVLSVRVRVTGPGPCPERQPGAGHPGWVFPDEVVVE